MKLFRMFFVSLVLSLIFAGAALAKADVTELYAEALMTGDVESLDKLLAPNYWHVSANGHIQDKEHFLASLKERKLVIDRIRLSNMRSTVMGDVTLVTANGELKGSATPPLPQGLMRYTMVLNKVGKETKIVLFQATPVVPRRIAVTATAPSADPSQFDISRLPAGSGFYVLLPDQFLKNFIKKYPAAVDTILIL